MQFTQKFEKPPEFYIPPTKYESDLIGHEIGLTYWSDKAY